MARSTDSAAVHVDDDSPLSLRVRAQSTLVGTHLIRHQRGFSLTELMIVVAIIGILAAIAVPNFLRYQARAKQLEAKNNLVAIHTAQMAYFAEHNKYGDLKAIGFAVPEASRR